MSLFFFPAACPKTPEMQYQEWWSDMTAIHKMLSGICISMVKLVNYVTKHIWWQGSVSDFLEMPSNMFEFGWGKMAKAVTEHMKLEAQRISMQVVIWIHFRMTLCCECGRDINHIHPKWLHSIGVDPQIMHGPLGFASESLISIAYTDSIGDRADGNEGSVSCHSNVAIAYGDWLDFTWIQRRWMHGSRPRGDIITLISLQLHNNMSNISNRVLQGGGNSKTNVSRIYSAWIFNTWIQTTKFGWFLKQNSCMLWFHCQMLQHCKLSHT